MPNLKVILSCIIISIVFSLRTDTILLSSLILSTGFLSFYYACKGRKVHYIWGFINYILMGYISLKNQLYGIFFFYTFIFAPLETKGLLTWNENIDLDNNIIIKNFTFTNSIIILTISIILSLILGKLLTLIPGQKLAFLDATSNVLNLIGSILLILQYRESWWLFLLNNVIDLIIWIVLKNSSTMIMVSIIFLILNIYGIKMWQENSKKIIKYEHKKNNP